MNKIGNNFLCTNWLAAVFFLLSFTIKVTKWLDLIWMTKCTGDVKATLTFITFLQIFFV